MNHIAEIDQPTFETVRPLIVRAELQSIRLSKCRIDTNPPRDAAYEGDVSIDLSTKASGKRMGEKLWCVFTFNLNATNQSPTPRPLAISLQLEAIYIVPSELSFSAKQIHAFVRTNGMLNVWPYWREFVQSVTGRAGLPPLTLPLFRIRILPKTKVAQQAPQLATEPPSISEPQSQREG